MRNTRDDVIAAALGVLDAYGLEFCSMRRVASALDVQPSALYHHVPNKQSLLAFMADEIVRGVGGADAPELCRSLRAAMLSIRDGADVVATASAFRLGVSQVESELADLVGVEGARTLLLYTFGHAQQSQTQLQAQAVGVLPQAADPRPDAHTGDNATRREGETRVETAAELAADLDRSFDRGIAIILAGLDATE